MFKLPTFSKITGCTFCTFRRMHQSVQKYGPQKVKGAPYGFEPRAVARHIDRSMGILPLRNRALESTLKEMQYITFFLLRTWTQFLVSVSVDIYHYSHHSFASQMSCRNFSQHVCSVSLNITRGSFVASCPRHQAGAWTCAWRPARRSL